MFSVLILLLAQADTVYNLRDFRLPDVGAVRLQVIGSLGFNGYDFHRESGQFTVDSSGFSSNYWRNYGGLSWDLRLLGEQRYLAVKFYSSLGGGFNLLYYQSCRDTTDSVYNSSSYRFSAVLDGSFNGGFYLKESPWFIGGSANLEVEDYSSRFLNILTSSYLEGEVFLQGGVGKIRDVTPAVHSWYFLEEVGKVSGENITSLADILARRWSYQLRYWRHQKVFYPDVEDVLVEQGVIEGFSVYEAMRLREIVENFPEGRLSGKRLNLGIGVSNYWNDWQPAIRLSFIGGDPFSRKWQLLYSSKVTVFFPPFYQFYIDDIPDYELNGGINLSYYVGETWKLTTDLSLYLRSDDWVYWRHNTYSISYVPLQVTLYFDNRMQFDVTPRYYYSGVSSSYELSSLHSLGLSAGLTWRLR